MKNKSFNSIFVLTTIALLLSETKAFFITEAYKEVHVRDNEFFNDSTYLLFYLFLWNFIIEISLIIVFHFKQSRAYVANHSFINICIITSQIINNFFLFRKKGLDLSNIFFVMEITITLLEAVQVVLGNTLNKKLRSEELVKKIFIQRFFHRNSGKLIYFLRKYQLYVYGFFYLQIQQFQMPSIIILPIILLTVLTHMAVYFICRTGNFDNHKHKWTYLANTCTSNKEVYKEIIQSIQQGDVSEAEGRLSGSDLSDIETNMGADLIKATIKWVIIENKIFDISHMRHPKGNYILKAIAGKDITREINGFKSFRFDNKVNGFTKTLKHKHVPRTMEFLAKNCIGQYQLPSLVVTDKDDELQRTDSSATLNLSDLQENVSALAKKSKTMEFYWKAENMFQMNDNFGILYASKMEKNATINVSAYWLDIFGKYFVVSFENNQKDYMYPLLSYSNIYMSKKNEWYNKLDLPVVKELKEMKQGDIKELEQNHGILEGNLDNDQKQMLETNNDMLSCYVPLFWSKNSNSDIRRITKNNGFGLLGPVGTGLSFNANTSAKVLIMVKDDGILPFIDFLEFLGQRALINLSDNSIEHPVFTTDYLYSYCNEAEFSLYWEISANYWNIAETIGLNSINTLNMAYKADTEEKVLRLAKQITIISSNPKSSNGVIVFENQERNSLAEIVELNTQDDQEFTSYLIKGTDDFVGKIVESSGEREYAKINIL